MKRWANKILMISMIEKKSKKKDGRKQKGQAASEQKQRVKKYKKETTQIFFLELMTSLIREDSQFVNL